MKILRVAILSLLTFVLADVANAQMSNVLGYVKIQTPVTFFEASNDIEIDKSLLVKISTDNGELASDIETEIEEELKSEVKILDRFELRNEEYFNRKPIILLQNARVKPSVYSD